MPARLNNPLARSCRFVLAFAALVATVRIVHLAGTPADERDMRVSDPLAVPAAAGIDSAALVDAELKRLYAHCPMAEVVDLKTAVSLPQRAGSSDPRTTLSGDPRTTTTRVDALLPPYCATANRVNVAMGQAMPRIRYPVPLHPQVKNRVQSSVEGDSPIFPGRPSTADGRPGKIGTVPGGDLHVAQLPEHQARIDASAGRAHAGGNDVPAGDWLIDPNEWFLPEDRARLKAAPPGESEPAPPSRIDEPASPEPALPEQPSEAVPPSAPALPPSGKESAAPEEPVESPRADVPIEAPPLAPPKSDAPGPRATGGR